MDHWNKFSNPGRYHAFLIEGKLPYRDRLPHRHSLTRRIPLKMTHSLMHTLTHRRRLTRRTRHFGSRCGPGTTAQREFVSLLLGSPTAETQHRDYSSPANDL
eukprot:scaffold34628_cov166-Amphora_coffeaeformis.AAC.16